MHARKNLIDYHIPINPIVACRFFCLYNLLHRWGGSSIEIKCFSSNAQASWNVHLKCPNFLEYPIQISSNLHLKCPCLLKYPSSKVQAYSNVPPSSMFLLLNVHLKCPCLFICPSSNFTPSSDVPPQMQQHQNYAVSSKEEYTTQFYCRFQ